MVRSQGEIEAAMAAVEAKLAALQAPAALVGDDGGVYSPGDVSWILASSALVFLMVPGVGYFYSGLTGSRNALTMILTSLVCVAISTMTWFCWGYSLAFSKTSHSMFIGDLRNAFLMNVFDDPSDESIRIPEIVYCLYQNMFAAVTPILALGSAIERGRLIPMFVFIFVWSTIVYCPIAYWVWNPNGWAFKNGTLDYAGGTPVHAVSGAAALAYTIILGKRRVHAELNRPNDISHIVMGTAFLWFGWFGFNGGSGLAADSRAPMAFLVTHISASTAGCVWAIFDYRKTGRLSASGFCTGAIAGMVAVTPASGYIRPYAAFIIGTVSAYCCNKAINAKEEWAWDDACDVFAVHGVGGLSGNFMTGIFASKAAAGLGNNAISGGLLEGRYVQLGSQIATSMGGFGYSFIMTYLLLWVMNKIPGLHLRASESEEELGMDAVFINDANQNALNAASRIAGSKQAAVNATSAVLVEKEGGSVGPSTLALL